MAKLSILSFIKRILKSHSQLIALVRNRPIAVVGLFPVYVVLSILIGYIASSILIVSFDYLDLRGSIFPVFAFLIIFFSGLFVLWLHYIILSFTALISNVRIEGDASIIARVAQALITTIFAYALIYYYLQLFGENKAFDGIHPIIFEKGWFGVWFIDRLSLIPPYETVVDCFYFSVTTISTLGFGDIHPITPMAKILTSCEVITGFILIVLSLGSVIGGKKETGKAKPNT
jgi:hypothetical protein